MAIEIGRRFDNKPLELPWPGSPHIQIGGETGAGKSGLCHSLIGAVAGHPNTAICGIDLKLVEFTPWLGRLTALATTPTEAEDHRALRWQPGRYLGRRPTTTRAARRGRPRPICPRGHAM